MSTEAKPFLKWAGGKGQLLSQLDEHLPDKLQGQEFTYIEPFVGGGAMLFHMLRKFPNITHAVVRPTQKPLGLLSRIILASTQAGAWVLDPFAGSSTTGIAANLLGRRFLGIEREMEFAAISKARREEIENGRTFATYKRKIPDIVKAEDTQTDCFACHEDVIVSLPFLGEVPVATNDDVLMYAIAPNYRKKTEAVGKLAIGIKEGVQEYADYNNIGYIMFHYWKNDQATPYKLLGTPKVVCKKDIPDGYLLRMATGAKKFLLLEYDPNKPADIGMYNILNVQRKGKDRYLPFFVSLTFIAKPMKSCSQLQAL